MTRIVLASASPRRRALLEALGLDVDVSPSKAEEHFEGEPEAMVESNALSKARDVAARSSPPALIIAADTLVFLGEEPLGKPATLDDARLMLRRLARRTHRVITGLAVIDLESTQVVTGHETTEVTFRPLSDAEIDAFVDAVKPVDRAGGYTVDGPGSLLVSAYNGCYQNVLGLPMVRLDQLLRDVHVSLFDAIDGDRARFL